MDPVLDINNLPQWDDPALKAGTKIRTALWLLSHVGTGNVFTKDQHRQAFPGIAQADRRLRDLRASGWVIHTSLEDASLNSNEQRFVAAGLPVWNPSVKDSTVSLGLSAKQRRVIFAEAEYQCSACGIAGGEKYSDAPWMSATLSVTRRTLLNTDGSAGVRHVVECKRCQSGGGSQCDDVSSLIAEIGKLSDADRNVIARLASEPGGSALLSVWAKFRQLSPASVSEVRQFILESGVSR